MNEGCNQDVETFWRSFLDSLHADESRPQGYYEAFRFGNTPRMADELAGLVLRGIKTATSDLLWALEAKGKIPQRVGDFHIVLKWSGDPVCIIQTVELRVMPFRDVDAAFAYDYGEGDRTVEWWRQNLWEYYAEEGRALGREPHQDMPLVCERFQVVYPP